MRHLLSIVLGLVLAPLIYVSAGYAAVHLGAPGLDGTAGADPVGLGLGLASAAVAGGLYALLVMTRLSPLGPVLAGLALLGVTLWALLDADSLRATLPATLLGVDDVLHAPVGFATALLAVPLLGTVFSPRRWRRSAGAPPGHPPSGDAPPDYDTPPTLAFDTPAYDPYRPPG